MRSKPALTLPPPFALGTLAIVLAFGWAVTGCRSTASSKRPLRYPPTPKVDQVDTYHGVRVPDPYRWLEDPGTPETRAWVEAQNELTFGYLESLPQRDELRARLTELWDYERVTVPLQYGGKLFYRTNDGLQNQSVLVVADAAAGSAREPSVLLDPNRLSEDGSVSLAGAIPSPSGALVALGLSDGGSDWRTWRVRGAEGGPDRTDVVTRNKFGGLQWDIEERGFFYPRYEEPADGTKLQARNAPAEIVYHRLGTSETEDILLVERPTDPGLSVGFSRSEKGDALIVSLRDTDSRHTQLSLAPLTFEGDRPVLSDPVALTPDFDARYSYAGDDGETIFVRTDWQAPNWRVFAIDPSNPDRTNWREIIPESEHAIDRVRAVGGRLIVSYLANASSLVRVFDTQGSFEREVELPGIGSISGFGGRMSDTSTFYSFASYTQAPTIYRYDILRGTSELFSSPDIDFDSAAYVTNQVFYESRDGTRIPMFLTHRRDLERNGQNPVYLYGYGGFNVSLTPSFNASNLVWLERGGIVAVANLRGGGEYGENWHTAGTKLQKQNVFDDFIAAAEWLVRENYTEPARLAIAGGSNGGLLVGACMTQRPDLFGACLPAVGVMDMLRYHRFTIGWAWAGDYGTSDERQEFEALYAYSPLHNLRTGTAYPPTLVTTADHDDRVVPAHSFKFAAALQEAQSGPEPVLIRIETRAGHGAGTPTKKRIDQAVDQWAFLLHELGR